MANKKRSPVVTIILIAIIGVAVFFVVRPARYPRPVPPLANWTCEECERRFVSPLIGEGPIECQACGVMMAVRTHYFYCRTCEHRFEGFRVKPPVDLDALMGAYKIPGGEWISGMLPRIACPICDDSEALDVSRPES